MTLIRKNNIFNWDIIVPSGSDYFIRFNLKYPRIIGALKNDKGLGDLMGKEQG